MFDVDEALLEKYKASIDLTNFPKRFAATFPNLPSEVRERWYRDRFKCLKYHLYLGGSVIDDVDPNADPAEPSEVVPILGMDFQENPHAQLFAQFLQKRPGEHIFLTQLQQETKKMMILWPRGVFKTSSVIVDMVQTILNYPNVRICFLTGGDQLAKRQLARLKRVFEKPTKRFLFLFPEFCMKSVRNVRYKDNADGSTPLEAWTDILAKLGTAHEFTVPCRTNDTLAEPTFAISTARSVKAGSHYEIIYIDDLVNDQNYRSVKLLEKCYNDYIDICPLLEPLGYIIMTGTRYSFGDTYERIQDMAKDECKLTGKTVWRFSVRDCWSHGCKNCEHTDVWHNFSAEGGNIVQGPCLVPGCGCPGYENNGSKGVLFPHTRTRDGRDIGHTLEFLEGEKIRTGAEFFANQYENKPIATESQTFTDTLIGGHTIHDLKEVPPYSSSITFTVGDLAYVGQQGRDYSVIFVCRLFQGRIYVFDCFFGNWDAGQVSDNVVRIMLKHRPAMMYFEKFNGWEAYEKNIVTAAAAKGIQKLPIQWEKGSQSADAKLIRIGSIKGVFTSNRLVLFGGMPGYDVLVQQLVKWPKLGRHDDFADCLGMVPEAPTGYQLENPPAVVSAKNWLRKFNQAEPQDDSYGDSGCGTGICC